jgi:hypothetical protein
LTARDAQRDPVDKVVLDQAPLDDALNIVSAASLTGSAGTNRDARHAPTHMFSNATSQAF